MRVCGSTERIWVIDILVCDETKCNRSLDNEATSQTKMLTIITIWLPPQRFCLTNEYTRVIERICNFIDLRFMPLLLYEHRAKCPHCTVADSFDKGELSYFLSHDSQSPGSQLLQLRHWLKALYHNKYDTSHITSAMNNQTSPTSQMVELEDYESLSFPQEDQAKRIQSLMKTPGLSGRRFCCLVAVFVVISLGILAVAVPLWMIAFENMHKKRDDL
ncbi:hypothetical protein CAPTEDRAFT_207983 [Capitella teleta]|uniref:Uncharacterized protein n=1 Tax=Capitella teleta TaxID=283909 RepID=R7UE56_CAPTE|nr:hypothetical protein CAPTEDRAFT_207983 [Capitella teleta]|eukprot:ELU04371.1 hypothetical protein CAPTEDRAFT_207983 [Capitella teleta]